MSDANQELVRALTIEQNRLGGFKNGKNALRFYLRGRKGIIDSGRGDELDRITAQGVWYIVEPFLPTKVDKKTGQEVYLVQRENFVEYIRDICRDELNCRREDLKIYLSSSI